MKPALLLFIISLSFGSTSSGQGQLVEYNTPISLLKDLKFWNEESGCVSSTAYTACTMDTGKTWVIDTAIFYDVAFDIVQPNDLFIVHRQHFRSSTNFGYNLEDTLMPNFKSGLIDFISDSVGCVIYNQGASFLVQQCTRNRGKTWTNTFQTSWYPPIYFEFMNDTLLYTYVNTGRRWRSGDGGDSWVQDIHIGLQPSYMFHQNKDTAWAIERFQISVFWTTNDGWNSSIRHVSPLNGVRDIKFVNDSVGYVLVYGGLLKTIDYGKTWNILVQSPVYDFAGMYLLNDSVAYFWSGSDSTYWKTTDLGSPSCPELKYEIPDSVICAGEFFVINSVSENVHSTTEYLWYLNDSLVTTIDLTWLIIPDTGMAELKVKATNGECWDSLIINLNIVPDLQVQMFRKTYTGLYYDYAFDDSMGNTEAFYWTFGDGDTAWTHDPLHTYDTVGNHDACLTLMNPCDTFVSCTTVRVKCPIPDVQMSWNQTKLQVQFTNQTSDGTDYVWTFGDGDSSVAENPVHNYDNYNSYQVCLDATGYCGSSVTCWIIDVECAEIRPRFTYIASFRDIDFVFTSPFDYDSVYWDFGDGATDTGLNPIHTYPSAGDYEVCVSASNECQTEVWCDSITVVCPAPSSNFTVDYKDGEVVFKSTANANSYLWDLGDSLTTSTFPSTRHQYDTSGTYMVCLTTTDVCGAATTCRWVYFRKPGECDREQVMQDYLDNYVGSDLTLAELDYQGSAHPDSCIAGTISQLAYDRTLQRINYYRRLVGLADTIKWNPAWHNRAQEAALMMKANNKLDHFPDSTWLCFSFEGFLGASGNLSLGFHSVYSVAGLINDFGANNKSVGHRRSILRSRPVRLSLGSTDNSGVVGWGGGGASQLPDNYSFTAYPPQGFVPAPLVYDRWSFSMFGASFDNATVTMRDLDTIPSTTIPITINPVEDAAGDPTIVWEPNLAYLIKGHRVDRTYRINVSNIFIGGRYIGAVYDVTIGQVAHPPACPDGEVFNEHYCSCIDSNLVQIEKVEVSTQPSLRLYPQPALGLLNIEIQSENMSSSRFHLYDMLGRSYPITWVKESSIFRMDVRSLPAGCYFLQYRSGQVAMTERFVKL